MRYRTFSMASVISPTVHRARAASIDSWSRLPWLLEQALVMASSASCACGIRDKNPFDVKIISFVHDLTFNNSIK